MFAPFEGEAAEHNEGSASSEGAHAQTEALSAMDAYLSRTNAGCSTLYQSLRFDVIFNSNSKVASDFDSSWPDLVM